MLYNYIQPGTDHGARFPLPYISPSPPLPAFPPLLPLSSLLTCPSPHPLVSFPLPPSIVPTCPLNSAKGSGEHCKLPSGSGLDCKSVELDAYMQKIAHFTVSEKTDNKA